MINNALASDFVDTFHNRVIIYIPDNGRDGDQIGRTGTIVIYDPKEKAHI